MWIGPQKSALIRIGEKRYKSIVSASGKAAGRLPQKEEEQAFRDYAQSLTANPIEKVLEDHPGSVAFNTSQIKKLQIVVTYDSELNRYDDYERLILEISAGKYRGAIERDTKLSVVKPTLEVLLGDRYQYRTMEGFPFL